MNSSLEAFDIEFLGLVAIFFYFLEKHLRKFRRTFSLVYQFCDTGPRAETGEELVVT